jgi:leucyl aminopeptidase (aminopeptidase T)
LRSTVPARPEDALARIVLGRCLGLRPGEVVTIETWSHALAWARAFVPEARRLGAEPALVLEDEEAFFRSLTIPGVRAVPGAPPALAERSDVYVYFPGPEAFPRLIGLPARDLEATMARHGPAWRRAARRVGLRAARMAIATVTSTAAARYAVDLDAWQRDVLRASLVPPERLVRAADPIVHRLTHARRARIRHANGTDLSVRLRPDAWVVEDGRVDAHDRREGRLWTQIPAGLVTVPLTEGFANGVWESNRPAYDRFGDPPVAEGGRFTFVGGHLREFTFDRGGGLFAGPYAHAGRGRDVAAGVTFGLNPAIGRAPELQEIRAGSVGLLIGDDRSIGGRHRSRFSLLTVLSEPDVELDGKPWWESGRPVTRTGRTGRSQGR